MQLRYTHPRNILVETLQRLYDNGMTTTSGGNISIRDDDGNIWITPSSIDKGALRPDDIVMISPDGTITGKHRPSVELPFHRSVYSLRSDIRAVLHAHSPALVAFSLVGTIPNVNLVPGIHEVCGQTAFAGYEIPGSEKLGNIIAEKFAAGADSVIMANHGAVMAGRDISQAFSRFEALDYVARIQINASQLGADFLLDGQPQVTDWPEFKTDQISPRECELRDEMAIFRSRAYRQRLLYTSAAFITTRLGDDDFIITPAGFDTMHCDAMDMVRVKQGCREAGKIPSSAAAFVREAYRQHNWIQAMFMTRPPHAMAFAVTHTEMDSRTIPESYIQLRDVPLLPSRKYFEQPGEIAGLLHEAQPVLMIENCGILTTGNTLLQAFDRLEVADFTANCILMAARIGNLRNISQPQVDAIIQEFKLPQS